MRVALIFIFLFYHGVEAWAGSFTAHVDKTVGTLDDQFVLTLVVDGKADEKPRVPDIEGVEVTAGGTSHSTSWVNGVITREVQYRYVLVPERVGVFHVPSMVLEVDGEVQRTLPITVQVRDQSAASGGEGRPIFIAREFSNKEVYVGEQVLEKIKIFYRVKLLEAVPEVKPSLDFTTIQLGKEKMYRQIVGGRNYNVTEINNAVIPLRARRKMEIPRYELKAVLAVKSQRGRDSFFDDFFSFGGRRITKRLLSDAAVLEVKPLPSVPSGVINLGVVGDFQIGVELDKKELTGGQSANLQITIAGRGNLRGMKTVDGLRFAGVKVYADKPEVKERKDAQTGLHSQAVMKLALLPTRGGEMELGAITFAFFNPREGRYVMREVNLGTLRVVAGADDERVVVGAEKIASSEKSAVAVLGEDLVTSHRGGVLLTNHAFTGEMRWGLFVAELVLIGGYAGLWFYMRVWRNRQVSRRSRAYREFKRAQSSLVGADGVDYLAGIGDIDKNFRSYLGDKLEMRGLSATTAEIDSWLQNTRLDKSLRSNILTHLRELEKILFAVPKSDIEGRFKHLVVQTNHLAKELEKRC